MEEISLENLKNSSVPNLHHKMVDLSSYFLYSNHIFAIEKKICCYPSPEQKLAIPVPKVKNRAPVNCSTPQPKQEVF